MNKTKFFLGSVVGAVAGVIGGILFAPQSGEKTRKDIKKLMDTTSLKDVEKQAKDIFGKNSEKAAELYSQVREELMKKVSELKETGQEIDFNKYQKLIGEVVQDVKGELKESKNGMTKITNYLKRDWTKVKQVLMGDATVAVSVKKVASKKKKRKITKA